MLANKCGFPTDHCENCQYSLQSQARTENSSNKQLLQIIRHLANYLKLHTTTMFNSPLFNAFKPYELSDDVGSGKGIYCLM